MKRKIAFRWLAIILGLFLTAGISYLNADMGDLWTGGWDYTNNTDYWVVESDGDLVPGTDSNVDIGASGTEVSAIYVDTLVLGGDSITGASQLSTPMEDQGTYVRIAGDNDVKLYDNGNIVITGDMDADSYIMENDGQLDNAANGTVTLTEGGDVLSIAFDGDDISFTSSDGSIELVPETDATEGTIDLLAGGDTDDYVEIILNATDKPSINFNGCDGIITASGGDIDFKDENLVTTGTLGAGAATFSSIAGVDTITGSTNSDVIDLGTDGSLIFDPDAEAAVIEASGHTSLDATLRLSCNASGVAGNTWDITVDFDDDNLEFFNETTELIDFDSSGNIDMVAGTTLTIGNDEVISNATDNTIQIYSANATPKLEMRSTSTSGTTTEFIISADNATDALDSWEFLVNDSATGTMVIGCDSATSETYVAKLTIAGSDGDITTTGDIEVVDDMDIVMGSSQDVLFQWDDSVDDQFLVMLKNTSTGAVTDPMFEILADYTHANGSSMTGNQEIFGVAKGTQGSNTALFTVDEDGDATLASSLDITGATGLILNNDEALTQPGDGQLRWTGDDTYLKFEIFAKDGSAGTEDAVLLLSADGSADSGDTYSIESEANGNDLTINNESTEILNLTKTGTLQIDGDFSADGGDVTFASATANKPVLWMESTSDAADEPVVLKLEKDRATEGDGDDIAKISFYASDDGDAASEFAYILAEAADVSAGKESGSIEISLEIDDTDTNMVKMFGDTGTGTTGHVEFNQDTADIDFHIDGDTTEDYFVIDAGAETTTLTSSVTLMPTLTLENTTNDTVAASIHLLKDKGAAGADGDDAGSILFSGDDSGQGETTAAKILAEIDDATAGSEAGKLTFQVMFDDATPALDDFLTLEGKGTGAGAGRVIINDSGQDVDTIIETATNATYLVVDAGTDVTTLTASTTTDPQLILVNTTDDTTAPTIQFKMDKGSAGADGDDAGTILFTGDDAAQTQTDMAKILAEVDESTDANEAGSLTFQIMFDDGTPALESVLVLEGQAATTAGQGIIEINSSADDIDTQISTVDDASFFTVDAGTGDSTLTLTSATASNPIFNLTSTNTDANCAVMNFRKDGEDEADNDDLGLINFYGNDSGNNDQVFAYILAESADITDTAEAGKMSFQLEVADTDTAFLIMAADAAASTGHFEINSGAADIDFHIDGNDQADLFSTDADTDTIKMALNQSDSQLLITQTDTTGTASEELININDDRTGANANETTEATLVIDTAGTYSLAVNKEVYFGGGQTRKERLDGVGSVIPDGTNPPGTIGALGTAGQSYLWAWQFEANAGADDIVYLVWNVPDGYVTDSARLNVGWSYSDAETDDDDVVFDMAILAVDQGTAAAGTETWDQAGSAFTEGDTNLDDGDGDQDMLLVTQLNIEVPVIEVDDTVIIKFWVDASETDLDASGTLDVHFFEIEYESTE